MRVIPDEVTTLIADLEQFLSDGLKAESLSKKGKERRETFLKRIKDVKLSNIDSPSHLQFPQEFKDKVGGDDSDEDEEVDSINDGASMQSERTDKDEDACEGAQQAPPVAAQDLTSVVKAGYLEKRRKDKQQKGEFSIDGYGVKINSTLRRDSKKDCCFEISAPDKRVYQFCASSTKEAEEWVKQIDFVLKDMTGIIPEEEEDDQFMYDDVGTAPAGEPDSDIYEELPEDEMPTPVNPPPKAKVGPSTKLLPPTPAAASAAPAADKSTDYANYYQGLWDCTGDRPDELSFKRGESIYILSKEYNNFGWWVGEKNGAIGIVPRDYLMELYAM